MGAELRPGAVQQQQVQTNPPLGVLAAVNVDPPQPSAAGAGTENRLSLEMSPEQQLATAQPMAPEDVQNALELYQQQAEQAQKQQKVLEILQEAKGANVNVDVNELMAISTIDELCKWQVRNLGA